MLAFQGTEQHTTSIRLIPPPDLNRQSGVNQQELAVRGIQLARSASDPRVALSPILFVRFGDNMSRQLTISDGSPAHRLLRKGLLRLAERNQRYRKRRLWIQFVLLASASAVVVAIVAYLAAKRNSQLLPIPTLAPPIEIEAVSNRARDESAFHPYPKRPAEATP